MTDYLILLRLIFYTTFTAFFYKRFHHEKAKHTCRNILNVRDQLLLDKYQNAFSNLDEFHCCLVGKAEAFDLHRMYVRQLFLIFSRVKLGLLEARLRPV
jgi:hypothetical protein